MRSLEQAALTVPLSMPGGRRVGRRSLQTGTGDQLDDALGGLLVRGAPIHVDVDEWVRPPVVTRRHGRKAQVPSDQVRKTPLDVGELRGLICGALL